MSTSVLHVHSSRVWSDSRSQDSNEDHYLPLYVFSRTSDVHTVSTRTRFLRVDTHTDRWPFPCTRVFVSTRVWDARTHTASSRAARVLCVCRVCLGGYRCACFYRSDICGHVCPTRDERFRTRVVSESRTPVVVAGLGPCALGVGSTGQVRTTTTYLSDWTLQSPTPYSRPEGACEDVFTGPGVLAWTRTSLSSPTALR